MPAVPIKVELGELMFDTEPPVPLTILHAPVPTLGVLAVNVVEVRPQSDN